MVQPHLLTQLQAAFAPVRRSDQLLLFALQIDFLHQRIFPLRAGIQPQRPRAYLQSIHGTVHAVTHTEEKEALTCGDGAFIRDEANITLVADTPLRALLIDLPV